MSAFSARVNIAPSESPARFRPRVPATLARGGLLASPHHPRNDIPPPLPGHSFFSLESRSDPRVRLHILFSRVCGESGEIGTGGARGRTRGGALAPVPVIFAAPPAVDRTRRASDPIGSRAPPRIERDSPRRGLFHLHGQSIKSEPAAFYLIARAAPFPTSPLPRRARQAHRSQVHRRPHTAHRRAH